MGCRWGGLSSYPTILNPECAGVSAAGGTGGVTLPVILPPSSFERGYLDMGSFELPEREPCPFCEYGNSELGTETVLRDELTAAFINPRQIEVGHTLVVPKRHAPTFFDLTAAEIAALSAANHKVASVLRGAFEPEGMTLFQNNGIASGQTVPHYHTHIVPRYKDGNWKGGAPPTITEPSPLESRLKEAAQVIAVMQDYLA